MNCLLSAVLLTLTPVLAHGATYYVAKTGSDSHSCAQARSISAPKLTIKAGLACLAGGDTLTIKAGTYTEGVEHNAIPSGLDDAHRTFVQAAAGETVIVNGYNKEGLTWAIFDRSYITIDGITMSGGQLRIGNSGAGSPGTHYITVQNGAVINAFLASYPATAQSAIVHHGIGEAVAKNTHIVYRNLEVSGGGPDTGHGIYMNGIADSIVENCNIHDNVGHGIHQYNAAGVSNNQRNTYRNNRIHDNGSYGILIGWGSDNIAYNNLVWGNGKRITSGGMWTAYGSASRNKFYSNTIYANTGNCIRIKTDGNAEVRNNICWQNSTNAVIDETGSVTQSTNLFTDPRFVDALQGNFALRASSPAINAGTMLSEVTYDFLGTSRTKGTTCDIGALQYTGTESPPPTNLRLVAAE